MSLIIGRLLKVKKSLKDRNALFPLGRLPLNTALMRSSRITSNAGCNGLAGPNLTESEKLTERGQDEYKRNKKSS